MCPGTPEGQSGKQDREGEEGGRVCVGEGPVEGPVEVLQPDLQGALAGKCVSELSRPEARELSFHILVTRGDATFLLSVPTGETAPAAQGQSVV